MDGWAGAGAAVDGVGFGRSRRGRAGFEPSRRVDGVGFEPSRRGRWASAGVVVTAGFRAGRSTGRSRLLALVTFVTVAV